MPTTILPKPNTALAFPACTPLSLGVSLSPSPLPTFTQPRMTSPPPHDSTIAPALVFASLDAPAPARLFCASSAAGRASAAFPVSVDLGAGTLSGTGDAMVGRSLTSLIRAALTLFRPCAVVISTGSIFSGISDAGAPDDASLFRQLADARRQQNVAGQGLLFFDLSFIESGTRKTRYIWLWLSSMFYRTSPVRLCWRWCPGFTL